MKVTTEKMRTKQCPKCGTEGISSKFCQECGEPMPTTWDYPDCGTKSIEKNFALIVEERRIRF